MGILDRVLGYSSSTSVDEEDVDINVDGLDYDEWTRIKKAYLLLSAEGLGAKVLNIEENKSGNTYDIYLEKVQTFTFDDDKAVNNDLSIFQDLTYEELKSKIGDLVDKLHELGYCHGDLNLANIGYRQGEDGSYTLLLLDLETMFKIDEPPSWVIKYIDQFYDFKGTDKNKIKDLINYDNENWDFDLEQVYE